MQTYKRPKKFDLRVVVLAFEVSVKRLKHPSMPFLGVELVYEKSLAQPFDAGAQVTIPAKGPGKPTWSLDLTFTWA